MRANSNGGGTAGGAWPVALVAGTLAAIFVFDVFVTPSVPLAAVYILPVAVASWRLSSRAVAAAGAAAVACNVASNVLQQPLRPTSVLDALSLVVVCLLATVLARRREQVARIGAELAERASRFHALVEQAGDGILLTDQDGLILETNPQACAILGYPRDELVGRNIREQIPADDLAAQPLRINQLAVGRSLLIERRLRRGGGTLVPVEANTTLLQDGRVQIIMRDITERRRAEAERARLLVLEREARAEAERAAARAALLQRIAAALSRAVAPEEVAGVVLGDMREGIGAAGGVLALIADDGAAVEVVDQSGIAAAFVARWRRLPVDSPVPIAEAARTGRPIWLPTSSAYAAAYPTLAAETIPRTGTGALVALPLLVDERRLGALGFTFGEPQPFADADRVLLLTAAQLCAQALDRSMLYRQARDAVRAREEFLSIAAHELKTPVTTLRGYAQLLARQIERARDMDPERVRRAAEALDQQSARLAGLVGKLLDVSRLTSGKLVVERADVDLVPIIRRVAETLQAQSGRHILFADAPAALVACVDPLRFEQVVTNLVDNAIRYSPADGAIEVGLTETADDQARLSVRDEGPGIPESLHARVFELFYQAGGGALGGLGLGLAISRRIAEAHGGTMSFESRNGAGTTFFACFPIAPAGPVSED